MIRSDTNDFFYQAEGGIRDSPVTGVQTCALPIFAALGWCCGVAASEGVFGPAQQIDLTSEFPGNSVELPRVTGISIGFGRRFKLGCWSPVIVQVTGAGEEVRGHLEVTVLDGDGDPVVTTTDLAIHVSPGQTVQCVVYAKLGRPEEFGIASRRERG